MIKTSTRYLLAICLLISANSFAEELSEANVKTLLSIIDRAVIDQDAAAVGEALSDNIEIIMNFNIQGQSQVITPSKQEYLAMLRQGWVVNENYQFSKSNVVIKMFANKAMASATVKETMTIQGQAISAESREQATIKLINGILLITKVVAHTKM